MKKALLAVAAVVVVAAIAVGAWVALGGDDEAVARGTCESRNYTLTVDDEDGGTEVSYELQSVAPDEAWAIVVQQGDTTLLEGERQTDEDAELDLDAPAEDNGSDEFTVTATPSDGSAACVATLTR